MKFILDKKIKNKLVIGYINEMNYKIEKFNLDVTAGMIEAVYFAVILLSNKAIKMIRSLTIINFEYDTRTN